MILVDRREPGSIIDILRRLTDIEVVQFEPGDYVFLAVDSHSVGVERKNYSTDLVRDLNSGQLERQLAACLAEYDEVVLLLEGIPTADQDGNLMLFRVLDSGMVVPLPVEGQTSHLYRAFKAMEYRVQKHGVDIAWAVNDQTVALTVAALYENSQKTEHTFLRRYIRPKPSIWTIDTGVQTLADLWPRVPIDVLRRLIKEFKTPWGVLEQSRERLVKVPGLGPGLLDALDKRLGRESRPKRPKRPKRSEREASKEHLDN